MLSKAALAALFVLALPASATVRVARPVAPAGVRPAAVLPVASLPLNPVKLGGLSATLAPSLSAPNIAPQVVPALAAAVAAPHAAQLKTAEAIATAESADQALGRLVELGVLQVSDLPEGETDRVALLKRVWDGVADKRDAALLPVDASWAVPAIRIMRGGKTFLVHGVAHGQFYPPNRRDVARLVAQIKDKKQALYSEQGIPLHYGFAYGLETMDHEVGESNGVPTRVAEAAGGLSSGGIAAAHALLRWAAVGGVGYSWLRAALNPAEPMVWLLALGLSVGLWLLKRGFQPVNRLSVLASAAEAEKLGSTSLAQHLRREAAAFFKPRVSAEDIVRLHLPPGPGAASDSLSPRSAAIAAAAAASAAAVVHVLVGYRHAAEIAWRLTGAEGPTSARSKERQK